MLKWLEGLFRKRAIERAFHDSAFAGRYGEQLAYKHLRKSGYRILLRNWRSGHDEIDIIAREGAVLVFVEVRLRRESALVSGYHSLTKKKKQALLRASRQCKRQKVCPLDRCHEVMVFFQFSGVRWA